MSNSTMREHWRTAAVLGFFLALGGGCDSLDPEGGAGSVQGASKSDADKGASKSKDRSSGAEKNADFAAGGGGAEAVAAAPPRDNERVQQALGEYRGCILGCLDDPSVKETNQETCKLTCRTNAEAAGVDPDTPVIKIADRFELCTSECYGTKMKDTDRETCKLNCNAVAESLQATLEFAAPESHDAGSTNVAQGCALSCMQQTSKCERLCGEQPGVQTDRETCRLLCDSNGEICLDTCHINAAKAKK